MIRFLAILLLVYLVYRLFRFLLAALSFTRKNRNDFSAKAPEKPQRQKIIKKDEGEYVDFEELED